MPASAVSLPASLPELGRVTIGVGWRLGAAVAVFLLVTALLRWLWRRGVISRPLGGLVKWLCGLALLWGLSWLLPPNAADSGETAMTLAALAMLWLAGCNGVDFVYAQLAPARGSGRPGRHILQDLLKFCILAVLVGWGLRQLLDIQLGSLLTSSAILTAVVGLSMQDTIGSLFSGLLLQMEKPFVEGDWIKAGDIEGRVTEVTWRYTKVVTLEANEVLLPNNAVAKDRLVNYSRPEKYLRQILHVPAPLDAPPVKVKSAIQTALSRAEGVVANPSPVARLYSIESDRLVYSAIYYIRAFNGRLAAADAVLSTVWYEFLERGIEIPAPARRVIMDAPAPDRGRPEGLAALSEVELLAGLTDAEMEMLARVSVIRQFVPGQTIVARGEQGTTMCFILSGLVAVVIDGKEVARLAAGQIFGEMALLTGEPRQADVRAVEATRGLEVDREGFRMVLSRHPEIIDRVREIFTARAAANRSARAPGTPDEATTLFARFCKLFL
ncbi:MscS Mechanosensitive ion channel [Solidesulfovibrio fructosivorans JJ]]|uniref:MscS Mechanosensitive ion channel n=1 Tax=Solidesulfovibrio fructosivorans JJ] TaxID=596151 RepID=E1JVR7_SOLFR|nr:mechanosensitive ion channel family protein [Solidesulfovibrio fructosivorans]EFL51555.1 MscS Mechanosensitive ion channel [Solidesulfovibrio fructosivorans JJ]]